MPGIEIYSENTAPPAAAPPDWEGSKENVKPLKAGRKLRGLRLQPAGETEAAGAGAGGLTVQQKLEAEER
jgi:hypothetical protein